MLDTQLAIVVYVRAYGIPMASYLVSSLDRRPLS